MKPLSVIAAVTFLATAASSLLAQTNLTPPQIQNIRVWQRPGTMFVDVFYNLVDPDSTNIYIIAEFSANGGATYGLPIFSLSGDIGPVQPGTNRHFVWNAWNDWAGNYTTNAKIRLTADDSLSAVPPPPTNAPGPNLVWISPGTFDMQRMGRLVYISHGFWMGRFEVTQGEYEAVIGNNPSRHQGDPNLPVEYITASQVNDYCNQLTVRERAAARIDTNWVYRLPTEAEWEYACRAGTTTDLPYGDDSGYVRFQAYAWYNANSGGKTQPVGSRVPNQWGLFDMMGNVWELCSDIYSGLPAGNFTDPDVRNGNNDYVVIRGGGYRDGPGQNFYRGEINIFYGSPEVGFRVVLAPTH